MNPKQELAQLRAYAESLLSQEDPDFFVSEALEKIEAAYEKTRDPSLHALRNVVAGQSDKVLIRQSELRGAWNKVSSLGRREIVQEHLGDLLGDLVDPRSEVQYHQTLGPGGDIDLRVEESAKYAGLFGFNEVQKFARLGGQAIEAELADFGIEANVALAASDDRFAVYSVKASNASFLVPTEIKQGRVLLPSLFYGDTFAEFNKQNLALWIRASGRTSGDAVGVLDVLNNAAGHQSKFASDEEYQIGFDGGAAFDLGSASSDVIPNQGIPSEISQEALDFGGVDFEQVFKEASAACGVKGVQAAKALLAQELKVAGLMHDKIVIEGELANGVTLGTHIRTAGGKQYISVPMEVYGNKVLLPSIFKTKTALYSWSDADLKRFASSDAVDIRSIATNLRGRPFSELYRIVIKKASEGDLAGAQEAMSVIRDEFDPSHYEKTMQDVSSLMVVANEASRPAFEKTANDYITKADDVATYLSHRTTLQDFNLLD